MPTDPHIPCGASTGSVAAIDWTHGRWLNEPAQIGVEGGKLTVRTDNATDFWRETYYGFVRDTGHFLGFPAPRSFTAQMHVRGRFDHLYDQAGFMLRSDAENWIKTGVEVTDDQLFLSTVVTAGGSDWSVMRPSGDVSSVWLRLTVRDGAARIQASLDGVVWPLLRLAPFRASSQSFVGPMACTPERAGLEVAFSHFTIGAAITTDLHDLS